MWEYNNPNELYHFQVKGAKHGIRRYQYEDGSLTPAGRKHYGIGEARDEGLVEKDKKYGEADENGGYTLSKRDKRKIEKEEAKAAKEEAKVKYEQARQDYRAQLKKAARDANSMDITEVQRLNNEFNQRNLLRVNASKELAATMSKKEKRIEAVKKAAMETVTTVVANKAKKMLQDYTSKKLDEIINGAQQSVVKEATKSTKSADKDNKKTTTDTKSAVDAAMDALKKSNPKMYEDLQDKINKKK